MYLKHLDNQLGCLSDAQHEDLVKLLNSHLSIFSDTPLCTNLIKHDIDMGDAQRIKQCSSRMPVGKCKWMEKNRLNVRTWAS